MILLNQQLMQDVGVQITKRILTYSICKFFYTIILKNYVLYVYLNLLIWYNVYVKMWYLEVEYELYNRRN